jgi:hypothetical protein
LPILVATGLIVYSAKSRERGFAIFIDFETLQYLFAASLAAIGGFYGIAVVSIASFFKIIRYEGEINGFRVYLPGSIGEAATLLSIGYLFGQKTRLKEILAAKSVKVPVAMLLVALCTISILTHTYIGFTITASLYVYLLLSAFYYGLSSITLFPGIVIVVVIGSIHTFLCGYYRLCGWIVLETLDYREESLLYQLSDFFRLELILANPLSTLALVYIAFLGRGLRKRWLSEESKGRLDDIGVSLTSLPGLLAAAIVSILIWEFSISLAFGWQVVEVFLDPVEYNRYFRIAVELYYTTPLFLVVPFISFCMGALYQARGVKLATACFMILVLGVQISLALIIGDTALQGTKTFLDTIQLSYMFAGVNIGRGLALPLYAVLGLIVTKGVTKSILQRPSAR